MVAFDTNFSSWKGKLMLVAPIIAGGVIGEYLDRKGFDDKFLSMAKIPKIGEPFDKLVPLGLMLGTLFLLFSTGDITSTKWSVMSIMAAAILGISSNYAAKVVMEKVGGAA